MKRRGFFKAVAASIAGLFVAQRIWKGRPLRTQSDRDLMPPPLPPEQVYVSQLIGGEYRWVPMNQGITIGGDTTRFHFDVTDITTHTTGDPIQAIRWETS